MSWWKYKPLFVFKWREPYGYTLAISKLAEKKSRVWSRPLIALFFFVFGMLSWWEAKSNPNKTPPSLGFVLPFAVLIGIAIAYFPSVVYYLSPTKIGFGEKAIVSVKAGISYGLPYEHMANVRFESFKGKALKDQPFL